MATREVETPKERILRMSADLFARNSYHGTGVQELSDAVGLGRGALYWHIKSKEDLLYEIIIRLLEEVLEQARALTSGPDTSPEERLRLLARDLVRHLAENRSAWTVSLQEATALTDERRERVYRARAEYEELWDEVLAEGAADGTLKPVDLMLRKGILGLFNNLHLWFQLEGPMEPEQIADVYLSLVLDGLRPRD